MKTTVDRDELKARIEHTLAAHYRTVPPAEMARMRQAFRDEGYVQVPSFVPPSLVAEVRAEAHALLDRLAVRRDMTIAVTGNTPRNLSNVRCSDIAQHGRVIPAVYDAQPMLDFMAAIFGEPCHVCPYENERFMLLSQQRAGDTHGWHWDDYAFSLIWLIESPPPELGGVVEFVPGTVWDKHDPEIVARVLRDAKVQRRSHTRDQVYLLRGDTCMHRVTPLKADAFRFVLNYAWASDDDLRRPISHETLDGLYS